MASTRDPFEGAPERPLSLHGYSWVEGNVVNSTDPTGEQCEGSPNPQKMFAACGGGGGGGLGMLLITALTVAASYMVYRNAVCLADEALDLGLGLASEALLPWNISLPHRQILDFSLSWEDADEDERPLPIPYPDDFDSCLPDMPSCSKLESAGGRYYGFDDALNSLTAKYPNAVERLSEREITDRGHCPGIGSHSQFYDTEYAGSITCCPCCDNSIPDVRCFVRWPH